MRSNLLSLQNISRQVSSTQNKLATGNKVNSAIDNPSSYYTARSLNNRANDLDALLDSMGQAVSTIKAATTAMETGIDLLAQLQSVAVQAMEQIDKGVKTEIVTSAMTADEIEALVSDNVKLILAEDIVLDRGLNITAFNVIIDGNGHTFKLNSNAEREAAILIDGGSANVKNLNIEATGERVYGIRVINGASLTLDNAMGIKVSGTGAQRLVNGDADLFDGKSNTQAIINMVGQDGLAAYATTQFYAPGVAKDDADFGQGQWYLPSMGELMQVMGYDTTQVLNNTGKSGITCDNKSLINDALSKLKDKGINVTILNGQWVWTSSQNTSVQALEMCFKDGYRAGNNKDRTDAVWAMAQVKDCYNPLDGSNSKPKIGDIMYSDKTYGSADNYDSSKTVVGVITDVSVDGADVKIISLKNLTFANSGDIGNFSPDNPYGQSVGASQWTTTAKSHISINDTGVDIRKFQTTGYITVSNKAFKFDDISTTYSNQFNQILQQYDDLVNDSYYKGVNLLKGATLKVNFDERGENSYTVIGRNISSLQIGLNRAEWFNEDSIENSLDELRTAVSFLRNFSAELGNGYSIIQNRQDFTDSLINVLTDGADKLTLADMNEESANMLALQTRQQLAVNSLSLAAQASQSILKLF